MKDSQLIIEHIGIKETKDYFDSYGSMIPIWYIQLPFYRSPTYGDKDRAIQHMIDNAKFMTDWNWLYYAVSRLKTTDHYLFSMSITSPISNVYSALVDYIKKAHTT